MKNFVVTQLHTEMFHPLPARMQRHRGKVQMVSLVGIDRRNPGKCHGGSGFLALARSYNNLKFNLFKIYWPWQIAGVKLREKNGAQVDRACGPDPKIMQPTLRPVFQWGIIFRGGNATSRRNADKRSVRLRGRNFRLGVGRSLFRVWSRNPGIRHGNSRRPGADGRKKRLLLMIDLP